MSLNLFCKNYRLLCSNCKCKVSFFKHYSSGSDVPKKNRLVEFFNDEESRTIGRKMPGAGEGKYNPIEILLKDFAENKVRNSEKITEDDQLCPKESDVVIVGGGIIGSMIAYFIKQRVENSLVVTVVERDPTYSRSSTVLSIGGIRQQFSIKENILMSQFSASFFRKLKENLSVLGEEPPNIQFQPCGNLFVATEKEAERLMRNYKIQKEMGVDVVLLSQNQIKEKFPFLNVTDLSLATYGLQEEGYFDPWLLLAAVRSKATSLGVKYVRGEASGFRLDEKHVTKPDNTGVIMNRQELDMLDVKLEDGNYHPIKFAVCVNAAGPWAGHLANLSGIGKGKGILSVPLPIEPRKRFVYVFHCPDGPTLNMPMLVDNSGTFVRREGIGGHYICSVSPNQEEEPDVNTLEIDYEYFQHKVWPALAHRIPAFECLKLRSAWAGYCDFNSFDENLIIGRHPYVKRMCFAAGSSGYGLQHAPAIGRAVMELVVDSEFKSIDLSRFTFDRILEDCSLKEESVR